MKITASDLQNLNSPLLKFIAGAPTAEAFRPWPPEQATRGSLVYVSTENDMQKALAAPAGIIIASGKLNVESVKLSVDQALFTTPSIPAAMALINPRFDDKGLRWPQGVHPSAQIAPTAKIGSNVSIGPGVVIGDEVVINSDCIVGPNTVIESRAVIGAGTHLHAQVFIGTRCVIGQRCEIHPHSTIGSDGFGFFPSKQGTPQKVPQLGIVIIEDDVEVGANCAIDRGTLTATRIGSGTKMDNLVHIAHNNDIGRNCLLAAGLMVAGSSKIGDNFACGGMVAIADHVTITNNVTLGGRTTVTKDILEPGAYTGYPVEPLKDGLRTIANLAQLTNLRKQMSQVLKHLGIDETTQ